MPSLEAKILGVILYMIPWSDSLIFGNHLFIKYPFIQIIQVPAIPIILIERSIPFGNLLLFLAGMVMVVTLWISSKAKKVTKTEIDLARQRDTKERFQPNFISRGLVRFSYC